MTTEQYDVVIAGTGAAGLFSALCLPPYLKVLLLTKNTVTESDSYLAQGGICVQRHEKDYDSFLKDTLIAGRYKNRIESVDTMIRDSRMIIERLIEYGIDFDRDTSGQLLYTREGAHSIPRILFHKDATGKEIVTKLISQVLLRSNITLKEHCAMKDLIIEMDVCKGIIAQTDNDSPYMILGKAVILATGGIGGLFSSSTNYRHLTGDGIAIALKHQIQLEDINYIQIHPTALYSTKKGRRFLISESVRGEGAILLNHSGQRFVDELLPRDIVTDAILNEMKREQSDYVYLSFEHMADIDIPRRFPTIYQTCLKEGYDITRDLLPVSPAQHYLMGGIKVTKDALTSMKNLYAVGETACNGVHGANRLASNSLLESLVFARRAADHVADMLQNSALFHNPLCPQTYSAKSNVTEDVKQLVLNEIKRKDYEFYVKWCCNESECG
jgi:L-aspartate oxidase